MTGERGRRGRTRPVAEAPAKPQPSHEYAGRALVAAKNRAGLASAREGGVSLTSRLALASMRVPGFLASGPCLFEFEHCVALIEGYPRGHVAQHVRVRDAGGATVRRIPWSDTSPWIGADDVEVYRGRMELADLYSDAPGTQSEALRLLEIAFSSLADAAARQLDAAQERFNGLRRAADRVAGTERASEFVPSFLR